MGFGSVKNVRNFTNERLFEKLSAIKISLGTPILGDIFCTQSVMYKNAAPYYDISVRVHKNKIIIGKIGADGTDSAATATQMEAELIMGSKDEDVQDIVIALAVICDHVSDKDSTWRHKKERSGHIVLTSVFLHQLDFLRAVLSCVKTNECCHSTLQAVFRTYTGYILCVLIIYLPAGITAVWIEPQCSYIAVED